MPLLSAHTREPCVPWRCRSGRRRAAPTPPPHPATRPGPCRAVCDCARVCVEMSTPLEGRRVAPPSPTLSQGASTQRTSSSSPNIGPAGAILSACDEVADRGGARVGGVGQPRSWGRGRTEEQHACGRNRRRQRARRHRARRRRRAPRSTVGSKWKTPGARPPRPAQPARRREPAARGAPPVAPCTGLNQAPWAGSPAARPSPKRAKHSWAKRTDRTRRRRRQAAAGRRGGREPIIPSRAAGQPPGLRSFFLVWILGRFGLVVWVLRRDVSIDSAGAVRWIGPCDCDAPARLRDAHTRAADRSIWDRMGRGADRDPG